MKLIEATWEKRNLNVNTLEIEFEEDDSFESEELKLISEKINELDAKYIVAKIPTGRTEIVRNLQKQGFEYIENQIMMTYKSKDITQSIEKFEKISKGTCEYIDSKEQIQNIIDEVRKGIFDTDRISKDIYFNQEIANNRYANWIMDEYTRKSNFYLVKKFNKVIGFFIEHRNGTISQGVLGGLFKEFKFSGLGYYWFSSILSQLAKDGVKQIKCPVSSNNIDIIKLHEYLGAKITSIEVVLIKHIN